jgi:hypothetical protein
VGAKVNHVFFCVAGRGGNPGKAAEQGYPRRQGHLCG